VVSARAAVVRSNKRVEPASSASAISQALLVHGVSLVKCMGCVTSGRIDRRIMPSTLLAWTDFHAKFRVKMSGLVCKSSDLARMVP
jgi:hypothetical protein